MRPVLLEMDGFASFRQRTTVDFDDVDYFALVGPTGAGKSTVIDAITFALYGSVARWDDAGAVAPALAPAVNRGTVRLVFEARGHRYVAFRELRRNAAGKVQQKVARLERLVDSQARGGIDDEIEDVAGTIKETAEAVSRLLGLDFNQFTKCVALPQGDFAEFLHATPSDRDRILTRLLGLDIYLALGKTAGARAARLTTTADALQSQLERETTDVSEQALAAARTAHDALSDLSGRVDGEVEALRSLSRELSDAHARRDEQERALSLLEGVTVPDDVSSLDADVVAARAAVEQARKAVRAAEQADGFARTAVRQHTPRSRLERLASAYAEQARLGELAPALAARLDRSKAAREAAEGARTVAAAVSAAARTAEADTRLEAERADEGRRTARDRLRVLDGVAAPVDLDALAEDVASARAAQREAAEHAERARESHRTSTLAAAALPEAVALDRAATAAQAAGGAASGVLDAVRGLVLAHARAHRDREACAGAGAALEDAERLAQETHARHVAGELRRDLTVGDTCPVCEQDIRQVPTPLTDDDTAQAQQALLDARAAAGAADLAAARSEAQLGTAVSGATTAGSALERALAGVKRALAGASSLQLPSQEALSRVLDGAPDLVALSATTVVSDTAECAAAADAACARLEALVGVLADATAQLGVAAEERSAADRASRAAADAVSAAEQAQRDAAAAVQRLEERIRQAKVGLLRARDPLVALGAPDIDDSDPVVGWGRLTSWVEGALAEQRRHVEAAEQTATHARAAHTGARSALAEAECAEHAAREAYESALSEDEQAGAEHRMLLDRLGELERELAGTPSAGEVQAELAALGRLEHKADAAHAALRTARSDAALVEEQQRTLDGLHGAARRVLNDVRDPLVAFGAPVLLDTLTLLQAWSTLAEWARSAYGQAAEAHRAATTTVQALTTAHQDAERALRQSLADAGLDTSDPRPVVAWAAVAVATARERAAGAVRDIEAARARTAGLQAQVRRDRDQALVAQRLAQLLAINGFPRWLSKHALEVLVTAASGTLMTLSAKQFELAVADNDAASFTVIDHADADAERPVKTLSGGETFQASLALALALSTHLGALASNGAAQLEAIFIDEGFGTLDEHTLDTVATTLETLATTAGRMVGVITHVPGLAARVPVRFAVQRDPRGSSVQRLTA